MSQSKVYLKVNRVDAATVDLAQSVTVADVHESMGVSGRAALLGARMRPLSEGQKRIAGPAVTAFCWPGDNLMMHRALYLAQPGDVLVVVQGCVRDVDQVRALGLPVWSTHIWAIHPDKRGHGLVNAPVVCEGVEVHPGDLIIADGDDVIRVPRHDAQTVVQAATAKMRKEDEAAEKVSQGQAVWDLSGAAAIYSELAVEEVDAAFDD